MARSAVERLKNARIRSRLGRFRSLLDPLSFFDVREMRFFIPSCNTDQGVYQMGESSGGKPLARNESDMKSEGRFCGLHD